MTEDCKVFPISFKPGTRRDGTSLETNMFRSSLWTRWHWGRARKMGGYKLVTSGGLEALRTLHLYPRNNIGWTHMGSTDGIQQIQLNLDNGLGAGLNDRTPAGFVANTDFLWTFSTMYDDAVGTTAVQVLAHVAPNLSQIANDTDGALYLGEVSDLSDFSVVGTAPAVSGGVCVIQPYAFLYDSDGGVNWSDVNLPATWSGGDSGSDRITDKKIVFGCAARGGTVPSGLFWSLDTLIRATFSGGSTVWSFNEVAKNISILSSRCVVEYDGVFYWPGKDRFFYYDGVVRELVNPYNSDFFYENLNKAARQKVWTYANQRYGEILFAFPFGASTEANWAVIYNVRGDYWYDTELPSDVRVGAFDGGVFWWPIVGGLDGSLWLHEYGYDKIAASSIEPIPASYTTADISYLTSGPTKQGWQGEDRWTKLLRVEPDWRSDQMGSMVLTIAQRPYAMSTGDDIISNGYTFDQGTEVKDFKKTGRLMNFTWSSNTQGGFFQQGDVLLHLGPDDARGD